MEDLSKIVETLAANNQKLRVAVTKTSAQGEEAQKATPNMMSFSNNENSIWFNNNKYGVWFINKLKTCTNESTNEELVKILGPATDEHLKNICDFILRGGIVCAEFDFTFYPTITESHYDGKYFNIKLIYWSSGYLNCMNYVFKLTDIWTCKTKHETISHIASIDIYESALETSIQMPNTVGGITAGTTVAILNGKKQNEIIDMLLFPEQQPQVVAPSATILLSSGFINNEIMEVGMAAPVAGTNIKTAFNQGYGRVAGQPDKKRAGALNSEASFIYYGGQESNKTLPTKVVLGTMRYNYHAAYAQGEQLVTSWGNKASVQPNPLPAGTINSAAVYIYGTYPYFANGADASTSNGDGNIPSAPIANNKLRLYKWTDTLIGAKFASEASSGTRLEFKFPSTKNVTKVEFYNTVSGKWEVFASANYAISDAGNIQVQGVPVAYKKLTTQGAMSGALQLRFTVANISRSEDDEPDTYNGEEITDEVFRSLSANSTTIPFESDYSIDTFAEQRSRPAGVAQFAVNFEPGGQAPLDARTVVGTKADLINAATYAAKNYYQGMLVIVKDTQEVYVLKDIAKITSADYSGWKRVGGGGATQTVVENVLTSTSTTNALSAAQGKVLNDSKLNKTDVVNNLTTPDASKALSAAQGKALSDRINGLGNVYKYKGTKPTISEVIAITNAVVGDVYNVEAEFSVGGKKYPAGTNVACIKNTSTTEHTEANWDPLGGTVDLSAYATKAEMNSGLNSKINTSAIKNDLTTGGVTNVLSAEQGKLLNDTKLNKTDVIGNLTNTDDTKALAASQGKILNDKKIDKTAIENTVNSSDVNKVLSAAMGKFLNDNKVAKSEIVDNTSTDDATKPLSARQGKSLQDEITVLENNIQDLQTSIPTKTSQLTNDSNYVTTNNVLTKTNTTVYNPTDNYHPATKKYVDDKLNGSSISIVEFDYNLVNALTNASTTEEVNAAFANRSQLKTNSIVKLIGINNSPDSFDGSDGYRLCHKVSVNSPDSFIIEYFPDNNNNEVVEIVFSAGNVEVNRMSITPTIPNDILKFKYINVADGSCLIINRRVSGNDTVEHINKMFGSIDNLSRIIMDMCENHTKYYFHSYNNKYNNIELANTYAYNNGREEYNLQFNISYYNNGPVSKRFSILIDTSNVAANWLYVEDILVSDNLQRVVKRTASEYESTTSKDASTMYGVTE